MRLARLQEGEPLPPGNESWESFDKTETIKIHSPHEKMDKLRGFQNLKGEVFHCVGGGRYVVVSRNLEQLEHAWCDVVMNISESVTWSVSRVSARPESGGGESACKKNHKYNARFKS